MKTTTALLPLVLGLTGCFSTPPSTPVPPLLAQAQRQAQAANKLTQLGHWPAASRQWRQVADLYALLNDRTNEAVALHNLAQAKSALGAFAEAKDILEHAALLNLERQRTNQWWRDQIALLQVEAKYDLIATDQRFAQLEPQFSHLASPSLRGFYLNELGLWRVRQKQFAAATAAFQQAESAFAQDRDERSLAVVEANYARLLESQANYVAARHRWQQALDRFEALADARGIAAALAGLGRVALAEKQDYSEAEKHLRRAAQNYRTLQLRHELADTLTLLKDCLTVQNKSDAAARIQTELDQLTPSSDLPPTPREEARPRQP